MQENRKGREEKRKKRGKEGKRLRGEGKWIVRERWMQWEKEERTQKRGRK